MAGKRSATSELNHDNWNQEEEAEERGTFQKASQDALKKRVIKTAKRRNPIRAEDGEKKSAFTGFTGFSTGKSDDFSFLKDIPKTDSVPKTNGINTEDKKTSSSSNVNIFNTSKTSGSIFGATPVVASSFGTKAFGNSTSNNTVPAMKKSETYCSKLKGLNESVSKWISKKVEENPLISLQPIFKDYEKYLNEIEKDELSTSSIVATTVASVNPVPMFNFNPAADKNTKAIPDSTSEKKEDSTIPTFKFGVPNSTSDKKDESTIPTFKFGVPNSTSEKSDKKDESTIPTFKFGVPTSTTEKSDKKGESTIPTFKFGVPTSTAEKSDKKDDSSIPTFKFGGPTANVSSSGPTFSFGSANAMGGTASFSSLGGTSSSTISVGPTFSFGSNSSTSGSMTFPTPSEFKFGGAANTESKKTEEGGDEANDDDREDEPPKVEFKPVVEKDHLYTIRCKVFVKKENNFGDRGVGNLYLKPIENSEKVQLIVRADTNLGNLLLNFILSESVPTKRMGKKDVMMVAIPNPDAQPPPTPILVRVKSSEEADNLLEVLEKHKK